MHRSSRPTPQRRAPLALAVLLALAGCGPSLEEADDAVACEGVRCTAGTCAANAGQPMCRCGPWEKAAGVMCEVAVFLVPDDHGGSPEEASVIPVTPNPTAGAGSDVGSEPGAAWLEGRISASERGLFDRDLFTFTAEAGHSYVFACRFNSMSSCNPRLLNTVGKQVGLVPMDRDRTLWMFRGLEAGPWYVEVSGAGETGIYLYQLQDMGPDDFGNHPGDAVLRKPSDATFSVKTTYLTDDDVIRFDAIAGHEYRLGCSLPSLESGVAVRLLGASGRVVDSVEGLGVRGPPQLDIKATQDQTWFMQVSLTHGQPPLTFDCWLKDRGLDDHGDVEAVATRVTPGVPFSVRMGSRKDVDVVAFTSTSGHRYLLRQQPADVLDVKLVAPVGGWVGYGNNHRYIVPGPPGTYFLKLTPWPGTFKEEPVQLVLEDLGPDDHGDSFSDEPTYAAVGTDVTGRFHTASDMDAVAFPVEADGVYRVTCAPACLASAQLAHSGMLFSSVRLGAKTFDVGMATHVTVLVWAADASETFTLRLERVGTDDHGDSLPTATPLEVPATVSGVFEADNDVEVFTVPLQAGRTYRVDPSSSMSISFMTPHGSIAWMTGNLLTPDTGGTYLVMVRPAGLFQLGSWEFSLREE
ncbi:hypothetical protein ACLESO_37470 [Pyxidicoccus sp. 3LG]